MTQEDRFAAFYRKLREIGKPHPLFYRTVEDQKARFQEEAHRVFKEEAKKRVELRARMLAVEAKNAGEPWFWWPADTTIGRSNHDPGLKMDMTQTEKKLSAVDRQILDCGGFGSLIFLAPPEIKSKDAYSNSSVGDKPGIYSKGYRTGSGPNAQPEAKRRLLTKDEALEYARLYDRLAKPDRGSSLFGEYPKSCVELVCRWYELLGESLHIAIASNQKRADELRLVRAALTGIVD